MKQAPYPSDRDTDTLADTIREAAREFNGDTLTKFRRCIGAFVEEDKIRMQAGMDSTVPVALKVIIQAAPEDIQNLLAASIALYGCTLQVVALTAGFKAGMEVNSEHR